MTYKQPILLFCALSLLVNSSSLVAIGERKCSTWGVVGFTTAVVVAGVSLWRYYTQEESNEELLTRTQKVHDAVHNKYQSLSLFHQPHKITITNESQLFELVGHRDLKLFSAVAADVPTVSRVRTALKNRIDSLHHSGKVDDDLSTLHTTVCSLHERLLLMKKFWMEYAFFFALHTQLRDLSAKYNHYTNFTKTDLINEVESHAHSQVKGDPYKNFAVNIQKDIQSLAAGMRNVMGSETIMMQANNLLYELKGLASMGNGLSLYFGLKTTAQQLEQTNKHYFYFDTTQQRYLLNPGFMQQIKGEAVDKEKYPCTAKAKLLSVDIEKLKKAISAVQNCAELFNDTFSVVVTEQVQLSTVLLQNVTYMRDWIASSPEYRQDQYSADKDQRRKKKDERERKRLQIEQEKAEAESRKARAEEDKNRVEREKIKTEQQKVEAKIVTAVIERETQLLRAKEEKERARKKEAEAVIEQAKANPASPQPPSYDQATQTTPESSGDTK